MKLIDSEYMEHPSSGSHAMRDFLERQGRVLNRKRIQRLMRLMGLEAIHAQEDQDAAEEKIVSVVKKLKKIKLGNASKIVEKGAKETLSYYNFPSQHWRSLRTNNPLERLMREIRLRTRVMGAFPDGQSASMLVAARLQHVVGTKWGTRRYLNMKKLKEHLTGIA